MSCYTSLGPLGIEKDILFFFFEGDRHGGGGLTKGEIVHKQAGNERR